MSSVFFRANDPTAPVFEISIGDSSAISCVKVNGQDISRSIKAVSVECRAGEMPKVTLEVVGHHVLTTVTGAIQNCVVKQPMADTTPIGTTWREYAPVGVALDPPKNSDPS